MTSVERLGRAYKLYRQTAASRSAILLLLANLIPLVGVVFFDWSLLTILVLYWLENGIVGFWNVPKIILAKGLLVPTPTGALVAAPAAPVAPDTAPPPTTAPVPSTASVPHATASVPHATASVARASAPATSQPRPAGGLLGPQAAARLSAIPRTGLAIFFAFHYGMFWFVHGIFVFALPTFAGGFGPQSIGAGGACFDVTGFPVACEGTAFGDLVWSSVLLGGVALFLSHGASFLLNYIGRGEYRTASPSGQMAAVYGRVVVLHLTIIFGSMVVAFLGAPIGALLVLVVLKTAFDLSLHLRERRKSAPSLAPTAVTATAPTVVTAPAAPAAPGPPPPPAPPASPAEPGPQS